MSIGDENLRRAGRFVPGLPRQPLRYRRAPDVPRPADLARSRSTARRLLTEFKTPHPRQPWDVFCLLSSCKLPLSHFVRKKRPTCDSARWLNQGFEFALLPKPTIFQFIWLGSRRRAAMRILRRHWIRRKLRDFRADHARLRSLPLKVI